MLVEEGITTGVNFFHCDSQICGALFPHSGAGALSSEDLLKAAPSSPIILAPLTRLSYQGAANPS